ncbi:MAG: hypothetical protein IMY67_05090 [Bacteroidetes bacterium]|nr:hypothetical protein [Bacteroidota bacterium]
MERRNILTLLPSIAIFISGYTPLFLIMILKDVKWFVFYSQTFSIPILDAVSVKFPYWITFNNPKIVIALFILSLLSLLMLKYILSNITSNSFDIVITKAKSRSSEVVNYTIPYMISFVAFDLSKWQDLVSLVLFLSILCLLSIRSQSVFINPILAAKGYGLYDCIYREGDSDKECVMLSRSDLANDTSARYKKLNNYMGIIAD